ncbi:CIC11C00000003737 [Sungouiella intermedia]|uniref:CIC11C00000003737 n=1 Tax=Sungouiella intermedia TaxID=45354 RepID=A0A1L0BG16_9ASCO|nr:CIC11C00000003737 [[Candida] intermedia]
MDFPSNPIVIVGGGLAGLSAAHQAYLRGANIVLLDKQGFLSGNSGKATSGINGALTRTQVALSIPDSVEQFYQDTLATAKDRANPALIKVLTYHSADAVHWLQEVFDLDLSVVSRLGGHSQPRTHRGKDAKFPGMAITYRLLETLENLADTEPERVKILKNTQVIDLILDDDNKTVVKGVKFKDLKSKTKDTVMGPVIMATGGYAADFTKNSLLRKYRPDIIDLPSTNGNHATGDGQKIIMKNSGIGIDMDKVQVHPTGLIDYEDKDVISGKSQPRFLFLGAEALRGEGGIILNNKGERFCDELGTRDYVSGEMQKQIELGNGPLRLVLNTESDKKLEFHIKHYKQRKLMRTVSGEELASEIGVPISKLQETLKEYNKAASGEIKDPFGKKYFPTTPYAMEPNNQYHVSFITRVLHFTMGGVKINDKGQVLVSDGDSEKAFTGLYAAGEVAGGVHGHNRLGGSSLLACVVYGRLAADQATSFLMKRLVSNSAVNRLLQISLHIDPVSKRITVDFDDGPGAATPQHQRSDKPQAASSIKGKSDKREYSQFRIPSKEFTPEEVAKHNKEDDCWVIVKNVVLDLTSFLNDHPGGKESIVKFAGQDATESFDMLHEDDVIARYAPSCVLGRVKGKTPMLEIKE